MRLNLASYTAFLWNIAIYCTLTAAAIVPSKISERSKALAELGAVPSGPRAEPFIEPNRPFRASLEPRVWKSGPDPTQKLCGPKHGSCDPGYCCSIGGNCGKGYHYCSGPACQLSYGDMCDGNIKPAGEDTIQIPRPLIGNVTYDAEGIYNCVSNDLVALTFDDGPYDFTWHLLDVLASYNAKATFFITGYPEMLRRMYRDGHQIAAHTWTHQNMTTLTEQQLINQMHYTEMAFRNVLGFFPTYMRPPYSECQEGCQALMKRLGYHITYYSLITHDYLYDDPTLIQASKDIFIQHMNYSWINQSNVQYITISHDNHYQTAYNLTSYMLDYLKFLKYKRPVTVGECLGDPPENWYRAASGAPAPSLLVNLPDSSAAKTYVAYSTCPLGVLVIITMLLV